ncbi:hypothetical protein [Flavobacterium notoginsengisoli]|uniref:hypothetical protein n=1 Tax=Flavobacterium notoginsengisoli TaxID=1478199 RepID=UPI0036D3CDFC
MPYLLCFLFLALLGINRRWITYYGLDILYFTQRNNKKKTKLGRNASACPKDFGITPCSFLTVRPSGLIPIPFGLSAFRPVKRLSFSFFRFSVFFEKIIFLLTARTLLFP